MRIFVFIISFCLALVAFDSAAQLNNQAAFRFLDSDPTARANALGGNMTALRDDDANLAYSNPALLNPASSKQFLFNFTDQLADVKSGYTAYTHSIDSIGNFMFGIHFINYGTFNSTEANGDITGNFKAKENAFLLGYSRALDSSFNVGANLKYISSNFETYHSDGVALDLGFNYWRAKSLFGASAVIKNLGMQLNAFSSVKEGLPFEIQMGVSKKLAKAPIRFNLGLDNLQKFNLIPPSDSVKTKRKSFLFFPISEERVEDKMFMDKLLRHVSVGAEVLITRSFMLRLGYDYRRSKELKPENSFTFAGFNFGLGLKIYKFQLSYAHNFYHLAGNTNTFSLTTRVSDFYTKK